MSAHRAYFFFWRVAFEVRFPLVPLFFASTSERVGACRDDIARQSI
jgi:hypothetical protein